MSTGDMINKDFRWFRHCWKEQIPALSELVLNHRIVPKFNLADEAPYQAWHIPLGELRRLDEILADSNEVEYSPMQAHHYM